jgi:hypothetical protein
LTLIYQVERFAHLIGIHFASPVFARAEHCASQRS